MKRALTVRNVAKSAGAVVLTLIVLDLAATAITFVAGALWLRR